MVTARTPNNEGMIEWNRADKLEGAMKVIDRDPRDAIASGQAAAIAPAFAGSGMETNLPYVLRNYAAVVRHAEPKSLDYFTFNMTNAEVWIGRAAKQRIMRHAQGLWDNPVWGRPPLAVSGVAGLEPRAEKKPDPKVAAHQVNPTLARAIKALGVIEHVPGCKDLAGAIKAALELAAESDDAAKQLKAVGELAEKMMGLVGEVMKHVGQDRELAESAIAQLGKVAKVFGTVTKVYTALNALTILITGHSITGAKKTADDRAEAVVELAAVFGGIAVTLTVEGFKWTWNTIGVPTKEAIETAGLRKLFHGEDPDALMARIAAMPVDPASARKTMADLYWHTFLPVSSLFSQANTRDLWRRFWTREIAADADKCRRVNETYKRRAGEDSLTDLERSQLAERYRSIALAFVREQVRQARAWK